MLGLRDDLVLHIVDVAFDCDVLRLPCDFNSRTGCALGLGAVWSTWWRQGLGLLKRDNWADRSIVSEPRVVAYVVQLHALLRIRLEELGDEVLGHAAEPSRPLDPLVQDVVEELLLVLPDKRWITRQQFEQEHAQVPDIERFVVTALSDHFRGQVLGRTAIGHSFPIFVEEV